MYACGYVCWNVCAYPVLCIDRHIHVSVRPSDRRYRSIIDVTRRYFTHSTQKRPAKRHLHQWSAYLVQSVMKCAQLPTRQSSAVIRRHPRDPTTVRMLSRWTTRTSTSRCCWRCTCATHRSRFKRPHCCRRVLRDVQAPPRLRYERLWPRTAIRVHWP